MGDVSAQGWPFTKLDSVAFQTWGGAVATPGKGRSDHSRHAEWGHTEARSCPLPQAWLAPAVAGALGSGCWGWALSQAQGERTHGAGWWGRGLRESALERQGFPGSPGSPARRPLSTPAVFLDFLGGAVHRRSPGCAHL